MTKEEANRLKDKFYAATATPEEERQLARLLRSGECPEEWGDERRALLALLPEENVALPEGFTLRLAERLEKERKAARRPIRLQWLRWSAAAMLVLAFGGAAFWYATLPAPDEPILVEQTEKPQPPQVLPTAPAPDPAPSLAEAPSPRVEEKKTPKTPKAKPRKPRKVKAPVVSTPAPEALAIAKVEPKAPPAASNVGTMSAGSLSSHMQRTLQSRDRLIAEARTYMASNCLNRSMSRQEISNSEQK